MNKYHKWKITDGDYIRNEKDISIAVPESYKKRLKRLIISVVWKVTVISLLVFLFIKMI